MGAPLLASVARSGSSETASHQPSNGNQSPDGNDGTPKKRLNPIKRKQIEDRVHELEEEISRTESAIANLETELQNFVSADESQRQSEELKQHKTSYASLMKQWEQFSHELSNSG
jgi:ATP-binding cassette subfamily F protein 3